MNRPPAALVLDKLSLLQEVYSFQLPRFVKFGIIHVCSGVGSTTFDRSTGEYIVTFAENIEGTM